MPLSLTDFDFNFPNELVALQPAKPRDSARLLCCSKQDNSTADLTFSDLPKVLPQGAVLVFNQTKVIPARVRAKKVSGGLVEILFTRTSKSFATTLAGKSLSLVRFCT